MSSPQFTRAAFARAAAFLHESRLLERALFAFHFENAPPTAALTELATYQNPDGGFHSLEADIGFTASTVLSTCHALHILHELELPTIHSLVHRTLDYLLATHDAAHGVWPIIPPHDNSQPHAPWWHYAMNSVPNWQGLADNPRPDVLACLLAFPCAATAMLIPTVVQATLHRLSETGEKMEMHGLLCYLRLYRVPNLPFTLKEVLDRVIPGWVAQTIERDPAKWTGYGLRPLDGAPQSDSPWRQLIAAEVESQLDFLIQTQAPDGSWHPHWNWGGTFPEAWEVSKRNWQAVLTLSNLRTLRSYGRIAS